jgi:hypothetical protein
VPIVNTPHPARKKLRLEPWLSSFNRFRWQTLVAAGANCWYVRPMLGMFLRLSFGDMRRARSARAKKCTTIIEIAL